MKNFTINFPNIRDMEKQNKQRFLDILKLLSTEHKRIIDESKTGEITMLSISIENESMDLGDWQSAYGDIPNGVRIVKIRYIKNGKKKED